MAIMSVDIVKDVHVSLQEQWKSACGHMCKWLKLTLWFLWRCQMLQMDQGHQTTDDGHHVMAIAHMNLWSWWANKKSLPLYLQIYC